MTLAFCERVVGLNGNMVCDRCRRMWTPMLHATGWLPFDCPDRPPENFFDEKEKQ